ncbi:MAG: ETC complex I subunit [Candidatus Symbiobacter sp.]|nr:ETC complex I subunit [Candidatus Symbiobacter sp.]
MVQAVRIIKSGKSAMQSGRGRRDTWLVQFESASPNRPDRLIGWSSSSDTAPQVKLRFTQLQHALDYAIKNGYSYTICDEITPAFQPKSYAENFRSDRVRG